MIVCFHLVAFLVNEYFTPEWQKNVGDITHYDWLTGFVFGNPRLLFLHIPECLKK